MHGDILGYHVYDAIKRQWLDDSERAWTESYYDAATFTDARLAEDIAQRERPDTACLILALMQ